MSQLFTLLGRNKSKDKARARKLAPPLPDRERLRYVAKIDTLWGEWERLVRSALADRLDGSRKDALPPIFKTGFVDLLQESDLGTFVAGLGDSITGRAVTYMRDVVRVRATVPGKEHMIEELRRTNLSLIRDVGSDQVAKLEALFSNAGNMGVRSEDLTVSIREILDVGQSRADLIARDQMLKFNASVQQVAQRSAGATEYIWSTSGDERVRPEHAALDGTRQSWDDPPLVDGERLNPGEAVQCRCGAVPVIDLFDDI